MPLRYIIETQGDHRRRVLVCCGGRYSLWFEKRSQRVRWALRDWPDDGLGITTHGHADDLDAAVEACEANHRLRQEIKNERPK